MSGSNGRENSGKPQNQKNTSAEVKEGLSGQASPSSPFEEAREIANKYMAIFSNTTLDSMHATLIDAAMGSGHLERNAVTLAFSKDRSCVATTWPRATITTFAT